MYNPTTAIIMSISTGLNFMAGSFWFKIFAMSANRLSFSLQHYRPSDYKLTRHIFEYRLQMFTQWITSAIRRSSALCHDVPYFQRRLRSWSYEEIYKNKDFCLYEQPPFFRSMLNSLAWMGAPCTCCNTSICLDTSWDNMGLIFVEWARLFPSSSGEGIFSQQKANRSYSCEWLFFSPRPRDSEHQAATLGYLGSQTDTLSKKNWVGSLIKALDRTFLLLRTWCLP